MSNLNVYENAGTDIDGDAPFLKLKPISSMLSVNTWHKEMSWRLSGLSVSSGNMAHQVCRCHTPASFLSGRWTG